jgi:protein-disulfide isomerase
MDDWQSRRDVLTASAAGITTVAGGYYVFGIGRGDEPPQCEHAPPADLDTPTIGDPTAPVTVAVYTDFSCSHCREYALDVFLHLRREYIRTGRIRYEHHDFPIPVNQWSRPAANAARAVQRHAGDTAMFEYAIALYRHQAEYSYERFGTLARTVNVAPKPVEHAARTDAYCQLLNADRQHGLDRGIEGTPTVFVNDRLLEAPTLADITTVIDNAIGSLPQQRQRNKNKYNREQDDHQ